ncbi:MAG TPA: response regulator [Pseudolabrys sp.]|nr:response regulator [Pseudolabrys sp.]
MSNADFIVFLVDDDRDVLKALTRMLEAKGYQVRAFSSARKFLSEHDASVRGCAIFDVSMPDLDGLELQAALGASGAARPIIFITGKGKIPDSVAAMKAGAIDFLTKPVRSRELLAAITLASEKETKVREHRSELESINDLIEKLTPREKEVLTHVVAGLLNKQIAARLGIVEKTVKLHRGRVMHKMGVRTVADLVRITERAGIRPSSVNGLSARLA